MEQRERIAQAWKDARSATMLVALLALGCLVVAFLAGRLSLDRPIDWGRVMSAAGAVLAGWGTYYALFDGQPSWKGQREDEILRRRLFRWTFLPGVACALLGAVL